MNSEKSTQIALGGVFSSLCLLLMFLSSVIPFSAFALPMLAGAMLTIVVIENGEKTAFLVYVSVSMLSIFIVPDIDAKLLFIAFFGYYSILKPRLGRISGKALSMAVKLLIFNTAMVLGYFVSLKLFGLDELAQESDFFGKYMPSVLLLGMNLSFVLYDILLTRYISVYIYWFKPRFLRR